MPPRTTAVPSSSGSGGGAVSTTTSSSVSQQRPMSGSSTIVGGGGGTGSNVTTAAGSPRSDGGGDLTSPSASVLLSQQQLASATAAAQAAHQQRMTLEMMTKVGLASKPSSENNTAANRRAAAAKYGGSARRGLGSEVEGETNNDNDGTSSVDDSMDRRGGGGGRGGNSGGGGFVIAGLDSIGGPLRPLRAGEVMKMTMKAFEEERISAIPYGHTIDADGNEVYFVTGEVGGSGNNANRSGLAGPDGYTDEERAQQALAASFRTKVIGGGGNGNSSSQQQQQQMTSHSSNNTTASPSTVASAHHVQRSMSLDGSALVGLMANVRQNEMASHFAMRPQQVVNEAAAAAAAAHGHVGGPNGRGKNLPPSRSNNLTGGQQNLMLSSGSVSPMPSVRGGGGGVGTTMSNASNAAAKSGGTPKAAASASAAFGTHHSTFMSTPTPIGMGGLGMPGDGTLYNNAAYAVHVGYPNSSTTAHQPTRGERHGLGGATGMRRMHSVGALSPMRHNQSGGVGVGGGNMSPMRGGGGGGANNSSNAAQPSNGGLSNCGGGASSSLSMAAAAAAPQLTLDPIGHSVVESKLKGFVYRLPSTLAEENAKRAAAALTTKKVVNAAAVLGAMGIHGSAANRRNRGNSMMEGDNGAGGPDGSGATATAASGVPPRPPSADFHNTSVSGVDGKSSAAATPAASPSKPPKKGAAGGKGGGKKNAAAIVPPLRSSLLVANAGPPPVCCDPAMIPSPSQAPTLHGAGDHAPTIFSSLFSRAAPMAKAADEVPLSARAGTHGGEQGGGTPFPHNNFSALIGTTTSSSPSPARGRGGRPATAADGPTTTTATTPSAPSEQQQMMAGLAAVMGGLSGGSNSNKNIVAGINDAPYIDTLRDTLFPAIALALEQLLVTATKTQIGVERDRTINNVPDPIAVALRGAVRPGAGGGSANPSASAKFRPPPPSQQQQQQQGNRGSDATTTAAVAAVGGGNTPTSQPLKPAVVTVVPPTAAASSMEQAPCAPMGSVGISFSPATATNANAASNPAAASSTTTVAFTTVNVGGPNAAAASAASTNSNTMVMSDGSTGTARGGGGGLDMYAGNAYYTNGTVYSESSQRSGAQQQLPLSPAEFIVSTRKRGASTRGRYDNSGAEGGLGRGGMGSRSVSPVDEGGRALDGSGTMGPSSPMNGEGSLNATSLFLNSTQPLAEGGGGGGGVGGMLSADASSTALGTNRSATPDASQPLPMFGDGGAEMSLIVTGADGSAASPSSAGANGLTKKLKRMASSTRGAGSNAAMRGSRMDLSAVKRNAAAADDAAANGSSGGGGDGSNKDGNKDGGAAGTNSPSKSIGWADPNVGLPQYGVPGNSRRAPHDAKAQKKALAAAAASYFNVKRTFPQGPIETFLKFKDPLDLVDPSVIADHAHANALRSAAGGGSQSSVVGGGGGNGGSGNNLNSNAAASGTSTPAPSPSMGGRGLTPTRRGSLQSGGIMGGGGMGGMGIGGMGTLGGAHSAQTLAAIAAAQSPVNAREAIDYFAKELKRIGQELKAEREKAARIAADGIAEEGGGGGGGGASSNSKDTPLAAGAVAAASK